MIEKDGFASTIGTCKCIAAERQPFCLLNISVEETVNVKKKIHTLYYNHYNSEPHFPLKYCFFKRLVLNKNYILYTTLHIYLWP